MPFLPLVAGFFMRGRMGGMKILNYRFAFLLAIALLIAFAIGSCGRTHTAPRTAPLASGLIESVTIWDRRAGETGSNTGHPAPQDSRVEVYDEFILVTPPDGATTLVLHGWYTNLKFKRDATR